MFSCQMGQKREGEEIDFFLPFIPKEEISLLLFSHSASKAEGFAHLDMAKDFPLLIDLLDFSTSFFLIFIDELAESAEAIPALFLAFFLRHLLSWLFLQTLAKLYGPSTLLNFCSTQDLVTPLLRKFNSRLNVFFT